MNDLKSEIVRLAAERGGVTSEELREAIPQASDLTIALALVILDQSRRIYWHDGRYYASRYQPPT